MFRFNMRRCVICNIFFANFIRFEERPSLRDCFNSTATAVLILLNPSCNLAPRPADTHTPLLPLNRIVEPSLRIIAFLDWISTKSCKTFGFDAFRFVVAFDFKTATFIRWHTVPHDLPELIQRPSNWPLLSLIEIFVWFWIILYIYWRASTSKCSLNTPNPCLWWVPTQKLELEFTSLKSVRDHALYFSMKTDMSLSFTGFCRRCLHTAGVACALPVACRTGSLSHR